MLAGQYGREDMPALPSHSARSNQSEDDGIEAHMVRDQIVSFIVCIRFLDIVPLSRALRLSVSYHKLG